MSCTCEYPYPLGIWNGHHPTCDVGECPEECPDYLGWACPTCSVDDD